MKLVAIILLVPVPAKFPRDLTHSALLLWCSFGQGMQNRLNLGDAAQADDSGE